MSWKFMQLFFKNEDDLYVLIQKDLQIILLKKKHKAKKNVYCMLAYIFKERKNKNFFKNCLYKNKETWEGLYQGKWELAGYKNSRELFAIPFYSFWV